MSKGKFKIVIDAPKEKVWKTLWNDETYRKWTVPFSEGSYMESDWKVGGKTLFLGDKENGMISTIDQIKKDEIMSFKHLGMLKDGKEDFESDEVKKWSGSLETYILEPLENKTQLSVEVDFDENLKDFFNETFPKALNIVKELSEK